MQIGINHICFIFQQMLDKNSGIALASAVGAVNPQTAAGIGRFIAQCLAEKVHKLLHIIAHNILTPQFGISTVRTDIYCSKKATP